MYLKIIIFSVTLLSVPAHAMDWWFGKQYPHAREGRTILDNYQKNGGFELNVRASLQIPDAADRAQALDRSWYLELNNKNAPRNTSVKLYPSGYIKEMLIESIPLLYLAGRYAYVKYKLYTKKKQIKVTRDAELATACLELHTTQVGLARKFGEMDVDSRDFSKKIVEFIPEIRNQEVQDDIKARYKDAIKAAKIKGGFFHENNFCELDRLAIFIAMAIPPIALGVPIFCYPGAKYFTCRKFMEWGDAAHCNHTTLQALLAKHNIR